MIKHLTEEEIAVCAEALESGSYQSLPHNIREHVAQCNECAEEILMVADIAHSDQLTITPEVPKKDNTQKIIAWSVSIAAAVALILLLFDLSDQSIKGEGDLLTQKAASEQEPATDKTPTKETSRDSATTQTEDATTNESEMPGNDNPSDINLNNTETSGNTGLIVENSQERTEDSDNKEAIKPLPSSGAPTTQMPASGVPPHLREKADTIRFLAHFEPNEDLEKLVERYKGNLRNADEEVEVTTPLAITTSNSSITIKWDNPSKKRLIIEVFNNQGNRIIETETTREEYTLKNIENGLYYWKLISENFELLFCGKIVIEAE